MTAQIIPFPGRRESSGDTSAGRNLHPSGPAGPNPHADPDRLCFNCVNAMVGARGTYCSILREEIWNERSSAVDCEEFEGF